MHNHLKSVQKSKQISTPLMQIKQNSSFLKKEKAQGPIRAHCLTRALHLLFVGSMVTSKVNWKLNYIYSSNEEKQIQLIKILQPCIRIQNFWHDKILRLTCMRFSARWLLVLYKFLRPENGRRNSITSVFLHVRCD